MSRAITSIDVSRTSSGDVLNQGLLALVRDGVVKLCGAFEQERVESWRSEFENRIRPAARAGIYPFRICSLGDLRTHYTLEIFRSFGTSAFYANAFVYSLASRLLEEGFFLATAAIACSEPGSPVQYIHRDQPLLFPGHRVSPALPASSLTVCIPLVDTESVVGGTEFQLGTHRNDSSMQAFMPALARQGDCIIWDSRLLHRGMSNAGAHSRPIVLLYYQRPWFFNFPNYSPGCEVKIGDRAYSLVPDEYKHLFAWAKGIWPAPAFDADSLGLCRCGSGLAYGECHGEG